MKLFRRRISRSAVLLFFNMVLVLVSALLVLVNMQARTELDESKRGFYSDRAFHMINEESGWEEIRNVLLEDEWNNGILFKNNLELESDTRGVFYKGDFKKLPLISGRYFTEAEVASDQKKAMIGQRFVKDTYDEGGAQYIDILGEKFEVVGLLSTFPLCRGVKGRMSLWRIPCSCKARWNKVGVSLPEVENRFVNSEPLSVWTHSTGMGKRSRK